MLPYGGMDLIPKLDEYKEVWKINSDTTIKPGVQAIEAALKRLGNPELNIKVIHVGGTNGKGSTIQYMEAILRAHGYSTGTFTSPAIKDLHDQIQFNGENATKDQIDEALQKIKVAGLSGTLTDFELLTVIAFLVLEKLSPDYVLIETGMGGLLDSTNVVRPIVSVITSIAIEHEQFLGTTLSEIAKHKAGIIKWQTPIVIGELEQKALSVVEEVASRQRAPLLVYGKDFTIEKNGDERFVGANAFTLKERKMKGAHQRVNAAVAIAALLAVNSKLEESKLQIALRHAQVAHRFEEILPNVFLDGAHNPAAARALRKTIEGEFPGEKVDFMIGMLKTKDLKGTLDELLPVAASFTFLTFDHPDAATGEELMLNCNYKNKRVTNAFDRSIILSNDRSLRSIVTGSLYLLVDLRYIDVRSVENPKGNS